MPAWAAALLLAISGGVLVLVALLAGRAGPLVAHPPTVPPPQPPTRTRPVITLPTMPSAPPQQTDQASGAWLWWVAAAIGALIVVFLIVAVVRALRRPGRVAPPPIAPPGTPLSPTQFGWLDEEPEADLTDDRTFDPHRAADDIIASWAAVERAAAGLGLGRAASSTPTEFLGTLAEHLGEPPGAPGRQPPAEVLLGLYHRARFDTTALAPGAATAARRAARTLIETWRPAAHHPDSGDAGDHPAPGGGP